MTIRFYVRIVEPGQPEGKIRVVERDESCSFDQILAVGRELMTDQNVSSVTIDSTQCSLALIRHNDFNGSLIIGSPKPNRRSWGRTWNGVREKRFGNNVRVLTRWHPEKGYAAYAIYNGRVLNRFDATSEHDVDEKYKLLCDAWRRASPSNVKDEAQDAPQWIET